MQADHRTGHGALNPEPAALIELGALQDLCRRGGHETIAVPRAGASALTLENAGLRLEIARLLARPDAAPHPGGGRELGRARSAPSRARRAIADALRRRVSAQVLERVVLVAS